MFIAARRVAFAVAVAAAPQALAVQADPVSPEPALIPSADAVDVPTNARLFLRDAFVFTPEQLDAAFLFAGEAEVDLIRSDLEQLVVLTPAAELAADTVYTLTIGDAFTSSFTTGSAADNEPPAAPTLSVIAVKRLSVLRPDSVIEVNVASELITVVQRDAAVVLDAALDGSFHSVFTSDGLALFEQVDGEDSVEVHAVAVDIAGNLSEPAVLEEDFLPLSGCGCAQTQDPAPLAALAACAALLLRRRRPSST